MNETKLERLFKIIDGKLDEYTDFLTEICSIDSKSEYKEGIDAVCEAVVGKGAALGFDIKRLSLETAGNVASLTLNPDAPLPPVCVSAHMDTVFEKNAFGQPSVRREGDILRGPGVIDCKGGVAVGLLVLDALSEYGYGDRPVKLILQSDEEVESVLSGGKTLEFMLSEAKNAAAFFNCECRNEGFITTRRKGIIRLCLKVNGKAAHAGDCFLGRSAIREAAHKVIALEAESVNGGITFNCGVIQGGTALNVVPDECRVYIDVRLNKKQDFDIAMETVKKIADKTFTEGVSSEVEYISDRKPMERTAANLRLFEHMNAVSERYGLGTQREFFSNGGSDAAYTALAGIPTVDDVGPVGGNYHTKEEWCLIPSIAESAKLICASIIEMSEVL